MASMELSKRLRIVALSVAIVALCATWARADILFDYRLDFNQPAGVTVSSDQKTGSVAVGTPAGTVINLDIYAIITNTATPFSAKKVSQVFLSEYSTTVTGNALKIRGDLAGDTSGSNLNPLPYVAVPYRGGTATIGWQLDWGEKDLDIGTRDTIGTNPNQFFRPDGGTDFTKAPAGTDLSATTWGAGAAEFFLGTAAFTITSDVEAGAQTQLQLAPRNKTDGSGPANKVQSWWETSSTRIQAVGNDPTIHVGTSVTLTTDVPEPSTIVLFGCGVLSLAAIWRRRKK